MSAFAKTIDTWKRETRPAADHLRVGPARLWHPGAGIPRRPRAPPAPDRCRHGIGRSRPVLPRRRQARDSAALIEARPVAGRHRRGAQRHPAHHRHRRHRRRRSAPRGNGRNHPRDRARERPQLPPRHDQRRDAARCHQGRRARRQDRADRPDRAADRGDRRRRRAHRRPDGHGSVPARHRPRTRHHHRRSRLRHRDLCDAAAAPRLSMSAPRCKWPRSSSARRCAARAAVATRCSARSKATASSSKA